MLITEPVVEVARARDESGPLQYRGSVFTTGSTTYIHSAPPSFYL